MSIAGMLLTKEHNYLHKVTLEALKATPRTEERAHSIVHLFAIEALFAFGCELLMVFVFAAQVVTLARFAGLFMRRVFDRPLPSNDC